MDILVNSLVFQLFYSLVFSVIALLMNIYILVKGRKASEDKVSVVTEE